MPQDVRGETDEHGRVALGDLLAALRIHFADESVQCPVGGVVVAAVDRALGCENGGQELDLDSRSYFQAGDDRRQIADSVDAAVSVGIQTIGILEGAAIGVIGQAVVVIIGVANIARTVAVGVRLIGIEFRRAIVPGVRNAVLVAVDDGPNLKNANIIVVNAC